MAPGQSLVPLNRSDLQVQREWVLSREVKG